MVVYNGGVKIPLPVRQKVKCAICDRTLSRVIWNYPKNRPIAFFFCNNSCKGQWQREQREALGFTREWLIEQYIVLKKTANDIATEIGRDPKRVWEWIRDYKIATRPRGTATHLKGGVPFGRGNIGRKHSPEMKAKLRAIALADGRVPYDPKVGPPFKGKRGAETPNWKGGVTPERQAFYSSPEWAKAIKAVWHRADAKCERCGLDHRTIDRTKKRFHVHHIVSFQIRELRAVVSNLALLCDTCHRWVHSKRNKNHEFIRESNGAGTGL